MNIYHPLDAIPQGWPTWTFFFTWVVLSLTTGMLAGPDLDAPGIQEKRQRILALECPAGEKEAHEVINEWAKAGRLGGVRRSILFDNVFVIVYVVFVAFACVLAARAFFCPGTHGHGAALILAWLPLLAGLLDYVENFAMYRMLSGFTGELLPRLSWWCATMKFVIILSLLAWGLFGAAWLGVKGPRRCGEAARPCSGKRVGS